MSTSFGSGALWKSSTDPRDDNEVDEADSTGESNGVPTVELVLVEGVESTVMLRARAALCGSAEELIEGGGYWTIRDKSRCPSCTKMRDELATLTKLAEDSRVRP